MTAVRTPSLAAIALIGTFALGSPCVAYAQGNGRPKTDKSTTTTTPTSSTVGVVATNPVAPQFGAWLDDASAPTRGAGAISMGIGHWRMAGMTQTNVPMLGGGLGLTDRLQISASVPFYRATASTWSARGMDDVYLGAKYTLVDPTLTVSEFGLAISPVVEVLSAGAIDGRVHFALPISVELRRLPFRVYGSAGYFTRGSMFGGTALEWTSAGGMSVTGSLLQSYSLKLPTDTASERQRTDVSVGAALPVGQRVSVFGNVGRSLTSVNAGGTSLALTGGFAVRFKTASR
jgi:hypothetical protein